MFKTVHTAKQGWLLLVAIVTVMLMSSQAAAHQPSGHSAVRVELGATVAADAKGVLWALSKQALAEGGAALVLQRSPDNGKTWSAPTVVSREPVTARGEERPQIAFGPKGEFYILYTRPHGGFKNPHIGDIRFIRSTDGGKSFSEPVSVHANRDVIVHAFGSLLVDKAGNLYVVWIDSRAKEAAKNQQQAYRGNGLYYAVSTDSGKTFKADYRIADHTCECCRLGLALDEQQRAVVMWRHIFSPNIRDHAVTTLGLDGIAGEVQRTTFDEWRIDACPHHGPSIAVAEDGTRHQAWFTVKENEGGIYYTAVGKTGESAAPERLGTEQARQAEVAVQGKGIAVIWKQFDGNSTALMGRISADNGRTWAVKELARTVNESGRPQLLGLSSGLVAAWHTQDEGMRIIPVVFGN